MKKILFISIILVISGCNMFTKSEQIVKPDVVQVIKPTPEKIYQSALEFYNKNYLIQASQAFLKAAEQNHAKSQFRLAKMYYDGNRADNNYSSEAAKWYRKAAEQGHIEAQYFLGALYFVGSGGVNQSFSKAKQWYNKAAKQGYIEAQLSLGMMYYNGKGGQRDLIETKKWLSLAATQGNEDATLMLQKINFSQ
ncbi:MAG: tetratricopeptide repeat protein [Candidatus Marithrix sp.]